jgi:hypothetical protein
VQPACWQLAASMPDIRVLYWPCAVSQVCYSSKCQRLHLLAAWIPVDVHPGFGLQGTDVLIRHI